MKTYIKRLFNKYYIVTTNEETYSDELEKDEIFTKNALDMYRLSRHVFFPHYESAPNKLIALAKQYKARTISADPYGPILPVFIDMKDAVEFKHKIDAELLLIDLYKGR